MRRFVTLVTFVLIAVGTLSAQQPAPALRIVVLEGEDGVNIIQQKTAVRPLIEVRDRNNLPVSGASVTFTIGGGGQSAAFAGGAQTLTVTTNAAGQAAASGLNAISSGAVQIQVQAAYQGQIATAAISQTNFATAAAAAQAGAGAGGGGTATGAASGAAGGGGGMSAATIGIIGGAVAGGTVVATQLAKGDSDEETFDGYDGTLSGQIVVLSEIVGGSTCSFTRSVTGTIRIEMVGGNASGRATLSVTQAPVSLTGNCIPSTTPIDFRLLRENTPVSGGPSALTFSGTVPVGSETYAVQFRGALSSSTITGTVGLTVTSPPGTSPIRSGSTTIPVTLVGPRP